MIVVVSRGGYRHTDFGCLGLTIANGIIGIVVVITVRVVGFLHAIEWVVDVGDGDQECLA